VTGAGVSDRAVQRHRRGFPGNLPEEWACGNMELLVGGSVMCNSRQKVEVEGREGRVALESGG
jgi:hypothetical protein